MYIDSHYPFEQIQLNYNLNSLSPLFSFELMNNHFYNHYIIYLNNLNSLLEKEYNYHSFSLDEILFNANNLPNDLMKDILFNAGGVYNHQVFFESLSPNIKLLNECKLKDALESSFSSVENFIKTFKQMANDFKGSGYIYLVCNEHNVLSLFPVINQDTTVVFNLCPLLCIDLWEHAYYLDYKYDKKTYIDNFIKLINWEKVNQKYEDCLRFIKN